MEPFQEEYRQNAHLHSLRSRCTEDGKFLSLQGDKMIKIDSKDVELYELITDVPYVSSPCVYVLMLLNIILPGRAS